MDRTKENIEFSRHLIEAKMHQIPGFHPMDILLPQLKSKKEIITALVVYSYFIEDKAIQTQDCADGYKFDVSQDEYQKRGALFIDLFGEMDFSTAENCREIRKVVELRFNWGQWVVQEIKERAEVAQSKQRDFAIPVWRD